MYEIKLDAQLRFLSTMWALWVISINIYCLIGYAWWYQRENIKLSRLYAYAIPDSRDSIKRTNLC